MDQGHGSHSRKTNTVHWRRGLLTALVTLGVGTGCTSTGAEDGAQGLSRDPLSDSCNPTPLFTANFEPELQWAWTGSPILPEFHQVMMTPIVIDVNVDGTPDIVFSTFKNSDAEHVWKEGVLRAISGDDGRDLWAVTAPEHRIKGAAALTAGDIDNDGLVEICGIPFDGRGIICYENDGSFKFRTEPEPFDYNDWGGPSLADLDGDGQVEIINGNRVYSNTGALKWVGSDGMGGAQYTGPVSFAADIDGDGKQEVINDRAVYRHDGTLYCANTDIEHGFAGVANFDGDTKAEIVVSGHGRVSLLDDNCALLWSVPVPGGGHGGAPNIGDFDGDGLPEIGLPGENAYSVLEPDGNIRWQSPTQDWSSAKSGSTAFDFDDDGKMEIIYADEVRLRIYDGSTGAVRFQTAHSSATTHENPVVADVDGDSAADLVVATNDTAYPGFHGIRVYHDRQEGWAPTRRLWNQHAYSVTNINDDGSIPALPEPHWLVPTLNIFRSNVAGYLGDNPCQPPPYNQPPVALCQDITVSANASCQGSGSVNRGSYDPDNKPGPFTVSESPGGPFSLGSHSVTLTANDGQASAQCVGIVTVVDTTKPAVSCPASRTVETCSPEGATVEFETPSSDNCGPTSVTCTHASGSTFPVGDTEVACSAQDGSGNASTCGFNVKVVGDSTPPTITCPISVDASVSLGQVGLVVDFTASATDNCGPAPVTCSHPSGALFLLGLTQVTCTATDPSGNSASCQFGVRVTVDVNLP